MRQGKITCKDLNLILQIISVDGVVKTIFLSFLDAALGRRGWRRGNGRSP